MQRMLISLQAEDQEWLVKRAKVEHVPQTEVVRRALRLYRQKAETGEPLSFEELARLTSGIHESTAEDGLKVQERLRDEWDKR